MGLATPVAAASAARTKWSDDAFLDSLRHQGDVLADACIRTLKAEAVATPQIMGVFARLRKNADPVPDNCPPTLKAFLTQTRGLPPGTDLARIDRGQAAFMTNMIPSVMVLLLKSLIEGYAAPAFTLVLNMSKQLQDHPYHRLMGTLQLLIDVASPHAFETAGRGLVSTQKMRLLHGGVRVNVAPSCPEAFDYAGYLPKYGLPINLEDLLGTMIGFSLLVVQGMRKLDVGPGVDDDDPAVSAIERERLQTEEDYYYVWRTFGQLLGIHPAGRPDSLDYLPLNLTEAAEFYGSYQRRHYVGATDFQPGWRERSLRENPDGVEIADAHIRMLQHVIATVIRLPIHPRLRWAVPRIFSNVIPRIYAQRLIGDAACARVGIRPVRFFLITKWLAFRFPRVWAWLWDRLGRRTHVWLSERFLQWLVDRSYAGGVTFTVPDTLQDVKNLVEFDGRAGS